MKAWAKVNFKSFRFVDAVSRKGEEARVHIGVVAQQVQEAFALERAYQRWRLDKLEAKLK